MQPCYGALEIVDVITIIILLSTIFSPVGGSTLGPGGTGPPNLAQAPKFLDTVVLLLVELIGSIVISLKFRLAVVASQMMRGQVPQILFPRTAPGFPSGKWLSSQLQGIAAFWPVPNYCFWQQRGTHDV